MQEEQKVAAMAKLAGLLGADTVVGTPIEVKGYTIIPLVSVGFGFGGGTPGSLHGGGGGIRPVAVIIIDDGGVRVEPVKNATSTIEGLAEIAAKAAQAFADNR